MHSPGHSTCELRWTLEPASLHVLALPEHLHLRASKACAPQLAVPQLCTPLRTHPSHSKTPGTTGRGLYTAALGRVCRAVHRDASELLLQYMPHRPAAAVMLRLLSVFSTSADACGGASRSVSLYRMLHRGAPPNLHAHTLTHTVAKLLSTPSYGCIQVVAPEGAAAATSSTPLPQSPNPQGSR